MTRKVPELSLMSYVEGNSQDKIKFCDGIFSGLKDYGFIVLTDHPIRDSLVQKAYGLVEDLFALPAEVKEELKDNNRGGQRGYTPFKKEHAKGQTHGDLKEFWHVGRDLPSDHPYNNHYPKNIWPKHLGEFQETMYGLYEAMDQTGEILLEAIGRGLDVPQNFFADMVKDGNSVLRAIHYPPTVGEDTKNHVRAAAHGDINLITLLVGATDSGLELLDRDGSWLPVQNAPGQIVVDTGDMMSRLTNEVLPSTIHRVVNPSDTSSARYSMPYFVHPHSDASLKCLPSCLGKGAKYPEITAGEFLEQRLKDIGLYDK